MMLLLILIFHVIYCFSDCGKIDAAKFNESIIAAKHYQKLLQVETVLKDVQQNIHNNMSILKEEYVKHGKKRDKEVYYYDIRDLRKTKQPQKYQTDQNAKSYKSAKFHPRALYNPLPTISDSRQGLTRWFPRFSSGLYVQQPPSVLRQPLSEYRMAIVPFNPGLRQGHPGFLLRPMRPRLNPPQLFSNYRYQNFYLRPLGPYMLGPLFTTRPTPEAVNQSSLDTDEVNSIIQDFPQLFHPLRPTLSRPDFNPAESRTTQLVTGSSSIRPTTYRSTNAWLHGSYASDRWRNAATNQSPSLSSKKSHGLFYLNLLEKGETPAPPHDSKNWDSTTAGDIKVRDPLPQSPTQRYYVLMERLGEGYMLVFMIELCRLIAVKGRKEVRQALHYTETIYNRMWNNGRLAWVDEPLQTVIGKLVVTMSVGDLDVVRTYASMMFHMLLRRRQALSLEVNSILDDADLLYNDAEGGQLFAALEEFENYPNTTKSSYWLCDSLIESFLHPFPRHYRSGRRQKLLAAINAALKTRFPRLQKQHTGGRPKNGNPRKKRKRKRHRYPYDMLRTRTRHSTPENLYDNIYGRQDYANMDYENYILRSMTPMTSVPTKFRAIPSNRYRIKTRPRTTVNLLHRPSRANSFNERNRKLRYQLPVTTPFQVKLDVLERNYDNSTKTTGHHHSGRKTPTAAHRHLTRDISSNESMLLVSRSPARLKGAGNNKTDVYEIKQSIKKSEVKKNDGRGKLRAGLLRKISVFPNMLRSAYSLTGRSRVPVL